jgi:hypothetical protein
LYVTLTGWAIVASPLLLALAGAAGLRPHPAVWSSEWVRRTLDWCDRNSIFAAVFLGGWVLVIVGYWITGQALADEADSQPRVG